MKSALRYALRVLSVLLCAAVIYLSLLAAGYISQDGADAVSSATGQSVSREDMQGKWVVLLNRAVHNQSGTTADWKKFFSFDEEVPLIMEDITCKVASTDKAGADIAEQYRDRLPANQMNIKAEAGVMLLSKAETGNFDVIILSQSAAETYRAQTLYDRDDMLVIEMGESNATD